MYRKGDFVRGVSCLEFARVGMGAGHLLRYRCAGSFCPSEGGGLLKHSIPNPKTDLLIVQRKLNVQPDKHSNRLELYQTIVLQKKNIYSDDFGLTHLQLETRFRGQYYLDLVQGGVWGLKKEVYLDTLIIPLSYDVLQSVKQALIRAPFLPFRRQPHLFGRS